MALAKSKITYQQSEIINRQCLERFSDFRLKTKSLLFGRSEAESIKPKDLTTDLLLQREKNY